MSKAEQIGHNLQHFRKCSSLTQAEVAEQLGVSYQAVSSWERGLTMPDITKLPEICTLYNITLDYLYSSEIHRRSSNEVDDDQIHEISNCNKAVDQFQDKQSKSPYRYEDFREDIVLLNKDMQLHYLEQFINHRHKPLEILCDNIIFLADDSISYLLNAHSKSEGIVYTQDELIKYVDDFRLMNTPTKGIIIQQVIKQNSNSLKVLDSAICMIDKDQIMQLVEDLVSNGVDPAEILYEFAPLLHHQVIEYLILELENVETLSSFIHDIDKSLLRRSMRKKLLKLQHQY